MASQKDAKTDSLNKEISEVTKGDIAPKPQSRSSSRSLAIRRQVGRVAPERHALPWCMSMQTRTRIFAVSTFVTPQH